MYAQQQTMTVNYVLNSVPTLFPPSSFPSPLLHFLLGGQTHSIYEVFDPVIIGHGLYLLGPGWAIK